MLFFRKKQMNLVYNSSSFIVHYVQNVSDEASRGLNTTVYVIRRVSTLDRLLVALLCLV